MLIEACCTGIFSSTDTSIALVHVAYFFINEIIFLAFCNGFETGTERTYSIINDVTMYDLKQADQPIGYRVSGAVKVGAIWGNNDNGFLLRFEVRTTNLTRQLSINDYISF